MSDDSWAIGERLRRERRRLDLSLADVSGVTGISKTYLLRLETDPQTNPSLEVLRKIAEAFDLTVADLVDAPALRFIGDDAPIAPSLRAFADEVNLTQREVEMLASIRWRKGEEPQTSSRWRYILDSLRASSHFDDDDG
jgi:transcriptional regulator with XRE-family HTH domain